ncbi:hypothetical protein [Nitrospira sp. Nam74]
MGGLIILLTAVAMIGCSRFTLEGLNHEQAFQANGADERSESNLPAIKALLARERQLFHAVSTRTNTTESKLSLQSSSTGELAPSSASPTSSSEEVASAPLRLLLPTLHPSTTASQQALQVQVPVPRTRSSADYSPQNRPLVPPYTFFAPTGSAYPGTIRCVPDYLGGQRCHNAP